MQSDPTKELDAALEDLSKLKGTKRPSPTRYHARALLVPFGMLAHEGGEMGAVIEIIKALTSECQEAWLQAVKDEMQLASAEYCCSIDARYLGSPDYDFDYTISARERLEARLLACDTLGYELPDGLRDNVQRCDTVFEPFLRELGKAGDGGIN